MGEDWVRSCCDNARMDYELMVCPVCGAQAHMEDDYDGGFWAFACDHRESDEYGWIEPIAVKAEPVGLASAVEAKRPEMEALRRERLEAKRERERLEAERWAGLTEEERQAEIEQRSLLHSLYADNIKRQLEMASLLVKQRLEVEPGTIEPD